jgi:hypothetical protein
MITKFLRDAAQAITHKPTLHVIDLPGMREVSPFILEADAHAVAPIRAAAALWHEVQNKSGTDSVILNPVLREYAPGLKHGALIETGTDADHLMIEIRDKARGGNTVPQGKVHFSIPMLEKLCRASAAVRNLEPATTARLNPQTKDIFEDFDRLISLKMIPKSQNCHVVIIAPNEVAPPSQRQHLSTTAAPV